MHKIFRKLKNVNLPSLSLFFLPSYANLKQVKTPAATAPPKSGLFKNIWNCDPRSPSTFISRTPIAMFRNNSASKFNHKALNESIESQVDLDILTPEEQDSLDSNKDLASIAMIDEEDFDKIPDPR